MKDPAKPRAFQVSVVVLNYNGKLWLRRCIDSVRKQTLGAEIEFILADNLSSDGSDRLAEELITDWPEARVVQNGGNLGYCEGNNRGAALATGEFLFFLNNDAWLEPDCLEKLLDGMRAAHAQAGMPLVMDFSTDDFQSLGAGGFDVFGWTTSRVRHSGTREVLMPEGCGYLIRRDWFEKLGGFDSQLFMYSDEFDLSLRLWKAGGRAVAVPASRMHHRGAVDVNPAGEAQIQEFRTSDTKRYFANRNGLIVVAKCTSWLWLLMIPAQCLALGVEALVGLVLIRRWGFVKRAYFHAVRDAWRSRGHVLTERRRLKLLWSRGDSWLLRFLKLRLNRWDELLRVRKFGLPKVSAR